MNAAGSTFARIFLGSLRVGPTDIPFQDVRPSVTMLQKSVEPTATQACLPSKATAKTLLAIYISRIHTWWPFLHLPTLRHWFSTIYDAPQACDSFQKFAVFVILAIASVEAENAPEVPHLRNLFSPEDYLATALRFYDMIPKDPELRSLQSVLLLTLWMMRSGNTADSLNLWQISRFAMSIAIELGYHRNSPNWEFGVLDLELRNRAWWCTYGLERTLSLRNQAIDAAFPQAIHDDLLRPDEASVAQFFHNKGIVPATLMFQLYAIGGDILESVYIARPRLSMTAGTMQNLVNSLRKRLMSWVSAACTQLLQHVAKGRNHFSKFIQLHDSLSRMIIANLQQTQAQNMPTPPTPGPSFVALPDDELLESHFNEAMMDANASFDLHAFDDIMRRIPNFLDQDMDYTTFQG
ncbi:hypothetical protein SLS56_000256 [Neofusicoccum ribis]|uniref:Xylanolytic transcriptional activator regulatory domain-containing protein n=1 Tax=Neofusicoccum ribis TaxID=45134 RepID=A0ABR3TG38_9PEZI